MKNKNLELIIADLRFKYLYLQSNSKVFKT